MLNGIQASLTSLTSVSLGGVGSSLKANLIDNKVTQFCGAIWNGAKAHRLFTAVVLVSTLAAVAAVAAKVLLPRNAPEGAPPANPEGGVPGAGQGPDDGAGVGAGVAAAPREEGAEGAAGAGVREVREGGAAGEGAAAVPFAFRHFAAAAAGGSREGAEALGAKLAAGAAGPAPAEESDVEDQRAVAQQLRDGFVAELQAAQDQARALAEENAQLVRDRRAVEGQLQAVQVQLQAFQGQLQAAQGELKTAQGFEKGQKTAQAEVARLNGILARAYVQNQYGQMVPAAQA